jgi:hypothetical protein
VILSSKTGYQTFKHVGVVCGHVLSFLSPLGLAALVGIAAVWAVEKAPTQTYVNTGHIVDATSGSYLNLDVPMVVQTAVKRAIYRTYLTDESGAVVYEYPTHRFDDPTTLDLHGQGVLLPRTLKPGTYVLNMQIVYQFNPFKNGNIFMTVATVNIH